MTDIQSSGRSRKPEMKRVLLCLPEELLTAVDREAKSNFMTRSDLMRRALLWYLRPAARAQRQEDAIVEEELEELYSDPEELLKILQQQKLRAGVQAMLRDMKRRQAKRRSAVLTHTNK